MKETMYDFPSRLKILRDKYGYTQSELAKKLSITRASVNAWEMALSAPSTPFLVELSRLFHVTTDYLLGLDAVSYTHLDVYKRQILTVKH